jgi:HK97 family phage major capsid protein
MATTEFLTRLNEERDNAWEEAKDIVDFAETQKRDLNEEEQRKFDDLNADIDRKAAQISTLMEAEKREAEAAEARATHDAAVRGTADADHEERKSPVADWQRNETRTFDLPNKAEFRDYLAGSGNAGPHTVPTDFVNQLYVKLIENSGIRRTNVNVISTASGNPLDFPVAATHPNAVQFAEATPITENDGTTAVITFGAYKFARLVQISNELLNDTGVDLEGYLATQLGQAVGNAAGVQFVLGDGTTEPQGVFVAASSGKVTASASVITAEELIDLQHSVIEPYRSNAYWLMNDATAATLRKLRWGTNEPFIWEPNGQVGQPDLLMGKPVVTDPNVPTIATGNKVIAFGDFSSGYVIREAQGVQVQRSDDYAFNADLASFRVTYRADGKLVDNSAIKLLEMD